MRKPIIFLQAINAPWKVLFPVARRTRQFASSKMRRGISVIVKRSRFTKAKISARRRGKEGDGRFLGPGLAAGRGPRATFRFRDVMIRERPRPEKGSGCLLIRNPRISSVVFHADRIDYRSGLRRLRMEPAILSPPPPARSLFLPPLYSLHSRDYHLLSWTT